MPPPAPAGTTTLTRPPAAEKTRTPAKEEKPKKSTAPSVGRGWLFGDKEGDDSTAIDVAAEPPPARSTSRVSERPADSRVEPSSPARVLTPADSEAVNRAPVAGVTPDAERRSPPWPGGRARSAPLVIRSTVRETPEARRRGGCDCLISGTVEVNGPRPLNARLRVAVGLNWFPAVADTVELFMGSPRAFRVPAVPCGPQRLKVTVLDGRRFELESRDVVAGFKCDGTTRPNLRVVLKPR